MAEGKTVDSWGRLKKVVLVKPVVYGSAASYLQKKRESDGHTHKWKIFFRPYYSEDPTKWIRKVTFKLHDSYTNPNRVFEEPPYEVRETGWGEFECAIRIFFVDSNERPVTIYHLLRLFPSPLDPEIVSGQKPLVSEYYDEIVFQEPSPSMHNALVATSKTKAKGKHHTDFEQRISRQTALMKAAKEEVQGEVAELREALAEAKELITKFQGDLASAGAQEKAAPSSANPAPSS